MQHGCDANGVRYNHFFPGERVALLREVSAAFGTAAQLGGYEALAPLEARIRVEYGEKFCRDALAKSREALQVRLTFELNRSLTPLLGGNIARVLPLMQDVIRTRIREMKTLGLVQDFEVSVDPGSSFVAPRVRVRVNTSVQLDTVELWINLG